MTDNKTKPTDESVEAYLSKITSETKHNDSVELLKMMKQITKQKPVLWGPGLIGFGEYHYKYESGREGDWFMTGFSPRAANISIYIMSGLDKYSELLKKLGRHKIGKGCLYIKNLDDIDRNVLKQLITKSYKSMITNYNS